MRVPRSLRLRRGVWESLPRFDCGATAAPLQHRRSVAERRRYDPAVIDPIAIHIGPLAIHWYGIIIATAVLAGAMLGSWEARRRGENPEVGWSILLWALVAGVLGARIYHVIHQWDFYRNNPGLIPQVWNGGLGIPGAIAGGAAALLIYTWVNKLPTARWLDIFAIALPLGQAIGRLGNFVNQELYGPPTTLPWGIPIDAAHRVPEWSNLAAYPVATTRFVPLFAYEAIASLLTLGALLFISRRFANRLFDGDMLLIYLMFYGLVRSYLETYRVDNWVIAGIPTATWLGVGAFLVSGGFLWLRHARGWGTPAARARAPSQTIDAADDAGSAGKPADAEAG
jgi:phosphatidylglycerol:prolipoprotein diacylglycerol transferase